MRPKERRNIPLPDVLGNAGKMWRGPTRSRAATRFFELLQKLELVKSVSIIAPKREQSIIVPEPVSFDGGWYMDLTNLKNKLKI